ncbi:synaptic vesicle membrane protein VAT-1 isoform 2 -like protein [Tropilaelaps mercedesae]|uniref:Synaptic vesicle membrane protein VAT-1 isoform 2-like protein n=1 Tax=Tropilaelaps mercedesae TaxID=418985 RepID=A0A1V9X0Z5_9ACAR|nr:synaptic vesicle membrane protein VAT-1 isoform 2 -like protein [Tropilaelaps mercedesae]
MTETEVKAANELTPVDDAPAVSATAAKKDEPKPEDPPVKEMRAVVLSGFGGLKWVKILQRPQPTAAEDEVLIRVHSRKCHIRAKTGSDSSGWSGSYKGPPLSILLGGAVPPPPLEMAALVGGYGRPVFGVRLLATTDATVDAT